MAGDEPRGGGGKGRALVEAGVSVVSGMVTVGRQLGGFRGRGLHHDRLTTTCLCIQISTRNDSLNMNSMSWDVG